MSICASKLGASYCAAYDLDPTAVRVARENIEASGAENIVCGTSDLLRDVDKSGGRFNVIAANLVADIILRMLPDIPTALTPDAPLILSGIIAPRADAIRRALADGGYRILAEEQENDWVALLAVRA